MATGTKREQPPPVQPDQPLPDEHNPQEAAYALEPLTDDLRSKLNVWGNSTRLCVEQIKGDAPEWAKFLEDIFLTVGGFIQGTQE